MRNIQLERLRLAGARRRRGKGSGNAGKPGKKLRLEHLQAHFGVGLKEAANQLGICATTLKRACRRHGERSGASDCTSGRVLGQLLRL